MNVLSIGEILWDVFPDRELLGGAPLNFSVNIARLGDSASLITAVGNDSRGRAAHAAMESLGLRTTFVQSVDHRATGVALVSTTPEGEPRFEIPRPAAFDALTITPEVLRNAQLLKPNWIYFGTLLQVEPNIEAGVEALTKALPHTRCFYDMNLRADQWSFSLIQRLCRMASVLKLNELEARTIGELSGIDPGVFTLESFCRLCTRQYEIDVICITLGEAGCCIFEKNFLHTLPGFPVAVQDTVGAGDAFAAAFLYGYHRGWPIAQTARFANALGSIVASRAGATPEWSFQECLRLASIPIDARGTVGS